MEAFQGATLIRGIRAEYRWFAGGQRLAVANEAGLWSVRPNGQVLELLAPAGPNRSLVGAYADGLLYLEHHPGALVAYLARPGQEPRQVGAVEHPAAEGYPHWATVSDSRLTVAVEGQRAVGIDLATGKARELGDEAIPVHWGALALSPSGRYLAYKLSNRGDAVRVLDLESGVVYRPGDESHVGAVAWSPAGQWAVRAAGAGSGLPVAVGANLEEGGTHLDLGDPNGNLRHLEPPHQLELVAGPWWSADGRYLAVVSGSVKDPEASRHLWVVAVESSEWLRLGTLPPGGFVSGFAPTDPSLMVHGPNGLWLWPANGDEMVEVAIPWHPDPESPVALPGGGLLYLTAEPQPRLLRQEPNSSPNPLLSLPGPAGKLTVQGNHAALIRYRDSLLHDLLIVPVDR